MPSKVYSQSPRILCSAIPLACALVGIGAAASQAAWSAVGTVKNASNSNLSGVAVTVKDSASNLKTTTDGNGTFVIGTTTGILASAVPTEFSVRQNGNELQIAFPGEGTLDLRLVDLSGSTLWKGSAPLAGGYSKVALPASEHRGAAILRVSLGSRTAYQPLTLLGGEGIHLSTRVSARSLDNNPTLVFKKVGYADTTFTMNAPTQTGISVVMRDSTIHLPPQPTTCNLPPSPGSGSGSFTRYSVGQGSSLENGHYALACGYHGYEPSGPSSDKVDNIANPQYFAAIPSNSPDDFNKSDMCGACVELTGQNGTKIVATITDECPLIDDNGVAINQPCRDNTSGHLDLSAGAFDQLGFNDTQYPRNTNWKFVTCPVTGNIVVRIKKSPASQIYVENTILPIKDILIEGASSKRVRGGAWDIGLRGQGATIVIKDYSDRTVTYTIPKTLGTDVDQNTGIQFPACK